MNMNLGALKSLFFFLFISFSPPLFSQYIESNKAEIKILDKITTKVETFEINVNDSIIFNSLYIKIFACYKNPPEVIPEDYVLLKIYDKIINSEDKGVEFYNPITFKKNLPSINLGFNVSRVFFDKAEQTIFFFTRSAPDNGLLSFKLPKSDLKFINEIGLKEQLSATRANGLLSMIKQMKLYAIALK